MMSDETKRLRANPAYRLAHWTLPWIALLGVIYVVWAMASTSTVDASSTLVLGMTGTVTGEKLVLLDSPGAGGADVGSLSQDEPFEVIEKRGTWYKIRDGEGHLGWVLLDPAVVKIESK
jgi:uncharacterized protein YgiM (DUF1202 family)